MAEKIDTGGPAYPGPQGYTGPNGDWIWIPDGMTILDEFAKAAMQALLTSTEYNPETKAVRTVLRLNATEAITQEHFAAFLARYAYSHAAAMLAEKRRLEGAKP